MKQYEEPVMEVIELNEDIIMASAKEEGEQPSVIC